MQELASQNEKNKQTNLIINSSQLKKGKFFYFLYLYILDILNNPLSNRNKELEKKSYVNTLKELNPIKMEILFPIKNPIDVSNGIKKMLMEFNEKAKSNEVKNKSEAL